MQRARFAFLCTCGYSGTREFAEYASRSRAMFTVVGFFDFFHGPRGLVPNAIDLHPVIGLAGRRTTR